MTAVDDYRDALRGLDDPVPYLLEHSGLPGPRGNIELGQAMAEIGTRRQFDRFLAFTPERAPVGTREEFLVFCAAVGYGRLAVEGRASALSTLRTLASDPRWRVREGVAMGLQRLGGSDMGSLLAEMRRWTGGNDYERRAAAAALCEPALLDHERHVREVLGILDSITEGMTRSTDRRSEAFSALRKGLGYCWSVAVAAEPDAGRPLMERWMRSDDPDVRWVMKQNLTKKRLNRAGADWVASWTAKVGARC